MWVCVYIVICICMYIMYRYSLVVSWRRLLTACKPYIRNSAQIAAIYAAGDFTQQKLITKNKNYNLESTKNVTIVGGA